MSDCSIVSAKGSALFSKANRYANGYSSFTGGHFHLWVCFPDTYNPIFQEVGKSIWQGLWDLDKMHMDTSAKLLDEVIQQFPDVDSTANLWEAVPGNARAALVELQRMVDLVPIRNRKGAQWRIV